jgi:ATP-dependent RNA/DNA helicase IGHMBP2
MYKEYFQHLAQQLQNEYTADLAQYQAQTQGTSLAERRANGLVWYPVAIRGSELNKAEYLSIELERTTHQDIPHQLRMGSQVVFFSNHNPSEQRIEATVNHASDSKLKILIKDSELPEWSSDGKLGVEILFDNKTYQEMFQNMKLLEKAPENNLFNVLIGQQQATFHTNEYSINSNSLNASQLKAVQNVLNANELAIIHGPPGTGKTTTLVQAIKAVVQQQKQQVMVVAPSNTAVDTLAQKLHEAGLNILRVGNPARVSNHIQGHSLDEKVKEHGDHKQISQLKKQANEYKNMAHKYKRNFGKAEREQRKALFDEAHRIMKYVDQLQDNIVEVVLNNTQVVLATLLGANHYSIANYKYNTLFIDEAGQAMEPACWVPIAKAKRVIMAGDHCQLPPTLKAVNKSGQGLSRTQFEACIAQQPDAVLMLDTQYRSHEAIMAYSSKVFYGDNLKAHSSVATQTLSEYHEPFIFLDTAGASYNELADGTSVSNPDEAALLLRHLQQNLESLKSLNKHKNVSIAIISPYKSQIDCLKELLAANSFFKDYASQISINTIDSFQGQERNIVYISLTRSNSEGNIGFLADIRRMNVAITRAQHQLVVVGDSATLGNHQFYSQVVDFTSAYQSAWDFME